MNLGLIYKYTSKTTGKSYIGKSMEYRFEYRQKQHKEDNSNTHFARAKRKYGYDDFVLTIIEKNIPKDKMSEREKFWIKKFDTVKNGYNSTFGGEGGNTFLKKNDNEMKIISNKISKAISGERNGNKGQYTGEKNPMYGKRPHNALYLTVENIETKETKFFDKAILLAKFLGYKNGSVVTQMRKGRIVKGWKIVSEGVETIESIA